MRYEVLLLLPTDVRILRGRCGELTWEVQEDNQKINYGP